MAEITIARGLTRLKTITAQLDAISSSIQMYGAWNNQKKIPSIANTKLDLSKNHAEATVEIASLYQQFHDLSKLVVAIKTAIEKANLETIIEIGGKTFTIAEALIYRRNIGPHISRLISSHSYAVDKAERDVNSYNVPILSNQNYDEGKKNELKAEVLYLVPNAEIKKLNEFNTIFLTEFDGRLNEVNAITTITIPD